MGRADARKTVSNGSAALSGDDVGPFGLVLADIGGTTRTGEAKESRVPAQVCPRSRPHQEVESGNGLVGPLRATARFVAKSPAAAPLEDMNSQRSSMSSQLKVGRAWSEDAFGTMLHKPSGVRISPVSGIVVDGVQYSLSPEDLEFEDGLLGAGSGGVVQVGRHRPSGERVAVKTLRVGDDEAKRELMLKEIRCLAQIAGCPYLIQWYAGFADHAKGCVHVVLEYMDRGSLADLRRRLDGKGLPSGHVACVAAQVLRGLGHLRTRMLLHRDVKPENILHNRAGKVKLTDFGISKDVGHIPAAQCSTFVGTATYMAPERAQGGDYSFESDVWSAGMVLYELATGRYPFKSACFVELYEGLCEGPEPRLEASAFPAPLRVLVAACLTREPCKRPCAEALCRREPVVGVGDEHVRAFAAWLASSLD